MDNMDDIRFANKEQLSHLSAVIEMLREENNAGVHIITLKHQQVLHTITRPLPVSVPRRKQSKLRAWSGQTQIG